MKLTNATTRALGALCLMGSLTATAIAQGPSPVKVATLVKKEVVEKRLLSGTIRPRLRVDVASIEAGRIESIAVREGDSVKKGQTIAQLDNRQLQLRIKVVEAQQAETRARMERFEKELQLLQQDLDGLARAEKELKGSVSDREMRSAQIRVTNNRSEISTLAASLKTLEAQLKSLTTSLADTRISAPFDGIITKRYLDRGAWVATGGKLVSLMSVGDLEAWIPIPESISPKLLADATIEITTTQSPKAISLNNIRILPDADPRSRNYHLVAPLSNSDNLLYPGMALNASVPNGKRSEQLVISSDALMRNAAGFFLYKVQTGPQGSIAMPIPVTIIFRSGADAIISSPGLAAGDAIIVEGNERLFPMMPVSVLK